MAFNLLLKAQLQRVINKLKPQIQTFAISSTSKDTVAKEASLNGFILGVGSKVTVRFTDTSAIAPSSGNITLNVNSTGAKTIKTSTNDTICTYEDADYFCDNKVQQFIYDGTNWVWLVNENNSSGHNTSSRLIHTETGNGVLTYSDILDLFFPYLKNLTEGQLMNSYIVFRTQVLNTDDIITTFAFSFYDGLDFFKYGTVNTHMDLWSEQSGLLIRETDSIYSFSDIDDTGHITGMINNNTLDSSESISLYVKEDAVLDALITTTEFENLE